MQSDIKELQKKIEELTNTLTSQKVEIENLKAAKTKKTLPADVKEHIKRFMGDKTKKSPWQLFYDANKKKVIEDLVKQNIGLKTDSLKPTKITENYILDKNGNQIQDTYTEETKIKMSDGSERVEPIGALKFDYYKKDSTAKSKTQYKKGQPKIGKDGKPVPIFKKHDIKAKVKDMWNTHFKKDSGKIISSDEIYNKFKSESDMLTKLYNEGLDDYNEKHKGKTETVKVEAKVDAKPSSTNPDWKVL